MLLGNLFDGEEADGSSNVEILRAIGGDRKMATVNTPPPPRPAHRLCGIFNQGATCYLNSLLQTLAFTPEFRGIHLSFFSSYLAFKRYCKLTTVQHYFGSLMDSSLIYVFAPGFLSLQLRDDCSDSMLSFLLNYSV